MLQHLPTEVLLDIYSEAGLESLSIGMAAVCRRLREVSRDRATWCQALSPTLQKCGLSPKDIAAVKDLRNWYFEQCKIDKIVRHNVNKIVLESLAPTQKSAMNVEVVAGTIMKHRLRVLPGLEKITMRPASLAHYHWACWLIDAAYRLEGIHRLLNLSIQDSWGNEPVTNPLEHVMALLFLRLDCFQAKFIRAFQTAVWEEEFAAELEDKRPSVMEKYQWAIAQVNAVDACMSKKSDFFSVLLKSSLFVTIAHDRLGLDAKLLTFPMFTYCCIQLPDAEVAFVDFTRGGKLRSIEDIQDRLALTNTPSNLVGYGISFYDILSTTYVWHSLPTPTNRKSILDLIEHAALDAKMHRGKHFPFLYSNLVRRTIAKNVCQLDGHDGSFAFENDSVGADGNCLVGQVCLLGTPQGPEYCVILEVLGDSCLVLRGSEKLRVLSSMLQPGFDGKLVSKAGLLVPDIENLDMRVLGEHFLQYDADAQMFMSY